MKLVDMKRPKKTKKEMEKEMTVGYMEDEKYPYGLCLRFDKNEVAKIPALKTINADTPVMLEARGFVKNVSVVDDATEGRSRHNVEIQIQKIGISSNKDPNKMNNKEYREYRKNK